MTELVHVRETCRLCGSPRLRLTLQLAQVPVVSPNVGTKSSGSVDLERIVAPLDNYLCEACGLNQLIHVVDPALIYQNYLYRTSVSKGLADHFGGLARAVIDRMQLQENDLVVEFGSNDGTLLSFFKQAGMRVLGVDPAVQIAAEASARGIPTRADFFGLDVAQAIRREHGPAKAILANNAMANIDDLDTIFAGVRELLAPDGAFVFETQYALDVFQKTLLDVIYHEHISMFSVKPVVHGLPKHKLELFDAQRIPTKGGSIRFWLQHAQGPKPIEAVIADLIREEEQAGLYDIEAHKRLAGRLAEICTELHRVIDGLRAEGRKVAAWGTSVGCAALIHQFELENRLDMLYDDTPFKERLSGPGYDLPVYTAKDLRAQDPALIVILAWRYAPAIMGKQEAYLAKGGRFAVPLPALSFHPEREDRR
jgi:SAM-dependent methyltransferase